MTADTPFWPRGVEGALSLSFDDALDSQLDNALPRLDERQLKGTFYVNPGRHERWERNLPRWQRAAARGHEIGNHTSRHPCSCNFGFHPTYCLEKLGLEDIAATIDEAEAALDALIPTQKGRRSFGYPCYQSYVGAGARRQSYVPLVARRFRVARGGGERANHPRRIDLSYTWSWAVEGHSSTELIAYVEQAVQQGHWAIICMHGVGAEHLRIDLEAFQGLVDHLAAQRRRIWSGTIIEIGDYIIERRRQLGL